MRALVTGASGFVGKFLVAHLLESGDEVLATDLSGKPWIKKDNLFNSDLYESQRLKHKALDVTNINECLTLIREFQPNVIYHLAGISFVPEAEDNFDKTLVVNVGAVNNIVRTCHLLENHARVVFISSAEVYGRKALEKLPLTESSEIMPANNYSLSKAMAELVALRYEQFGKVIPVIMRPFNHIGPGQDRRFVVPSFASQLAAIAKGQKEPSISVGNLDALRDFTDVRDIVRAYRLAGIKGQGLYNLCSGVPRSVQSILDELVEIADIKIEIKKDPERMRASEVPEVYGSYERAKNELGWQPEIEFSRTLRDTYEYFYGES